jgi:hypothetical protein
MLSFFLALSAAVAGLAASKAAGTAVATAIPGGLYKKNRELERNMRLGINTEFEKHQTKKMVEAMKNGKTVLPPEPEMFEIFRFEADQLPESMHWLLKVTFVLTEKELFKLLSMVRRQMMDSCEGPFFKTTVELCKEHGISYQKLTHHARLLSGQIDYEELIWLSENRLADPLIGKKLLKTG